MCVCVCVCVREREIEREGGKAEGEEVREGEVAGKIALSIGNVPETSKRPAQSG